MKTFNRSRYGHAVLVAALLIALGGTSPYAHMTVSAAPLRPNAIVVSDPGPGDGGGPK